MKKIALFGATGLTGSEFLKKALDKGYRVKVLVRNRERLTYKNENLHIIEGDILNSRDVEKAIEGTEVVVSLFGHVKGSPENLQTNGTKNIIEAMNKHGLQRIISLSGGGLPYEEDKPKLPDHLIRTIMKIFVPKILNDAIAHAEVLKNSGLEWTVIRGPRLTTEPEKGEYRVGWVGVNASTRIGRADLADFILKETEQGNYIRKMPFVSY